MEYCLTAKDLINSWINPDLKQDRIVKRRGTQDWHEGEVLYHESRPLARKYHSHNVIIVDSQAMTAVKLQAEYLSPIEDACADLEWKVYSEVFPFCWESPIVSDDLLACLKSSWRILEKYTMDIVGCFPRFDIYFAHHCLIEYLACLRNLYRDLGMCEQYGSGVSEDFIQLINEIAVQWAEAVEYEFDTFSVQVLTRKLSNKSTKVLNPPYGCLLKSFYDVYCNDKKKYISGWRHGSTSSSVSPFLTDDVKQKCIKVFPKFRRLRNVVDYNISF